MKSVEAWLIEDQRMPRKQRRTAKVMYESLLELGYQGSDRTVREYVRRIRQEMQNKAQEQAIRLEQIPGEAPQRYRVPPDSCRISAYRENMMFQIEDDPTKHLHGVSFSHGIIFYLRFDLCTVWNP